MIELATVLALLVLGFTIGTTRERMHLAQLAIDEEELAAILVSDLKRLPPHWRASQGTLVRGEVVIGSDYFKSFIAGLVNLFGGRIRAFETLMERARREAIVRMKRQAYQLGSNAIWCLRMETSTIGRGGPGAAMAEVHVYGTAYLIDSETEDES